MASLSVSAPSTNASLNGNTTISSLNLVQGWIHGPTGRGTLDIIQSCIVTIFLCSWSMLCLNVPIQGRRRWALLKLKAQWMLLTILWPELTLAVAVDQWESASQGVENFSGLGYSQWTIRHAFFADVGGFVLQAPDFPSFPIDGQQLAYLFEKGYIPYPHVDIDIIRDKNKADGFARAVMLIQISWFSLQCIGRAIQHLSLSTFELSTVASIFCAVNTLYFWYHKPLDVEIPIYLQTETRIADILVNAGNEASNPYSLTPLDFLVAPTSRTNVTAPWWAGLVIVFDGILFHINKGGRPIKSFANTRKAPSRNSSPATLCYRLFLGFGYLGIHFGGWNMYFPTSTEQTLWRIACLLFVGLIATYFVLFFIGTLLCRRIAKFMFNKEANTVLDAAMPFPRWTQVIALLPFYGSYSIARIYILVEGFIALRRLPLDAYTSVDWSYFIPHI